MKINARLSCLPLVLACALLGSVGHTLAASATEFTYQGCLTVDRIMDPIDQPFDFRFKLFDAATGGNQIGPTLTATPAIDFLSYLPATNGYLYPTSGLYGYFTLPLDFGSNAFCAISSFFDPPPPRYLAIEVRPADTNPAAPYTLLSPRQPITPTPQAFYAGTAGTAANFEGTLRSNQLAGTYSGAVAFLNVSNQFAGNGDGLTELNASQIRNGTLSSARLDPNVVLQGQDASFGKIQAKGEVTVSGDLFAGRLVAGYGNLLTAPFGVIAGGTSNIVTAPFAAILGGQGNFVGSDYSVICGGFGNVDQGHLNFIGGGTDNTIETDNRFDVIPGGDSNLIRAKGLGCAISGGGTNCIGTNCQFSVIGGGRVNTNQPDADYTVIGGGYRNTIQTNADYTVIGGGNNNTVGASANYSVISGGTFNNVGAAAANATVGGGENNFIQTGALDSTIGGGKQNLISTNAGYATLGGGVQNSIRNDARQATIGGGSLNLIGWSSLNATISGGANNTISSNAVGAAIGGGSNNFVGGGYATIAGGEQNNTALTWVSIGGGRSNSVGAIYGAVSGGEKNSITGTQSPWAAIGGGQANSIGDYARHTVVSGGHSNVIVAGAAAATVGGGEANLVEGLGLYATIPGGLQARATNYGQFAYASGQFATQGDAQMSFYVLRRSIPSASTLPLELFLDGDTATRRMSIPPNTTWTFDILVVGRSTGPAAVAAGYHITGTVTRVGAGVPVLAAGYKADSWGPPPAGWTVVVATGPLPAGNALTISATADRATRWVATVRTAEVTY